MDVDTVGMEDLRVPELDETASIIDGVVTAFGHGALDPTEAIDRLCAIVVQFVRYSLVATDEVELILDYARDAVGQIAHAEGVTDPVLLESFDERVLADQMADVLQARLDILLQPLEAAAQRGDAGAASQLVDLCRTGLRSDRVLLSLSSAAEQILRTAYRLGLAQALRDAVSPVNVHDGQIANRQRRPAAFELALNLLAHLGADPDRGADARSALLDLAGYVETAGEAVTRLPMHLLDGGERQRLLGVHEARVELFTSDPVQIPLGLELLRDNRVGRSAVWQAFDARHID